MAANVTLIILIVLHVFIQLFWTLTSQAGNYKGFLNTWKQFRSIPIAIFELFGLVQVLFFPYIKLPTFFEPSNIVQIFGLVISVTGVAYASWAKKEMGLSWGRPAQHNNEKQKRLIITGPFRFSRNPIYVGLLLLFTGQQVSLGSFGILIVIVFIAVIFKAIIVEERLLQKYFGEEYIAYKNRVPRFL